MNDEELRVLSGDRSSPTSPDKIKHARSIKELLDMHQQLRHETAGLRLQLAAKQEVIERMVTSIDTLQLELSQAHITIDSQANLIDDLTRQLEMFQRRHDQSIKTSTQPNKKNTALSNHQNDNRDNDNTINNRNNNESDRDRNGDNVVSTSKQKPPQDSSSDAEQSKNDDDSLTRKNTNIVINTTRNDFILPRLAKDRIEAFNKTPDKPLLPDETLLPPELAPACRITMAARAGDSVLTPRTTNTPPQKQMQS